MKFPAVLYTLEHFFFDSHLQQDSTAKRPINPFDSMSLDFECSFTKACFWRFEDGVWTDLFCRVPIIKCKIRPKGSKYTLRADVSTGKVNGIEAAKLICTYVRGFPPVRPLVLILKRLLKVALKLYTCQVVCLVLSSWSKFRRCSQSDRSDTAWGKHFAHSLASSIQISRSVHHC